jgi:hypothetical protein
MAKDSKGCDLCPGDKVCGDVPCPDSGKTIHVEGYVVCIDSDTCVKVAYAHTHLDGFDPSLLTKDA